MTLPHYDPAPPSDTFAVATGRCACGANIIQVDLDHDLEMIVCPRCENAIATIEKYIARVTLTDGGPRVEEV